MLEVFIDENNKNLFDIDKEINRFRKVIRRERQKD